MAVSVHLKSRTQFVLLLVPNCTGIIMAENHIFNHEMNPFHVEFCLEVSLLSFVSVHDSRHIRNVLYTYILLYWYP